MAKRKGPRDHYHLYTVRSLEGWKSGKAKRARKKYVIKLLRSKAQYFEMSSHYNAIAAVSQKHIDDMKRHDRFAEWCKKIAHLVELQVARDTKFAFSARKQEIK